MYKVFLNTRNTRMVFLHILEEQRVWFKLLTYSSGSYHQHAVQITPFLFVASFMGLAPGNPLSLVLGSYSCTKLSSQFRYFAILNLWKSGDSLMFQTNLQSSLGKDCSCALNLSALLIKTPSIQYSKLFWNGLPFCNIFGIQMNDYLPQHKALNSTALSEVSLASLDTSAFILNVLKMPRLSLQCIGISWMHWSPFIMSLKNLVIRVLPLGPLVQEYCCNNLPFNQLIKKFCSSVVHNILVNQNTKWEIFFFSSCQVLMYYWNSIPYVLKWKDDLSIINSRIHKTDGRDIHQKKKKKKQPALIPGYKYQYLRKLTV